MDAKNFDKLKLNEEGLKKVKEYAEKHHVSEEQAKREIIRDLILQAKKKNS